MAQSVILTAGQPSTPSNLPVPNSHRITIEAGAALTSRFRRKAVPGTLISGQFNRDIMDMILAQEDYAGVRIYNAMHEDGQPTFVLVGVDVNGNDLWHGEIGEEAWPCPPICSDRNPLNGD